MSWNLRSKIAGLALIAAAAALVFAPAAQATIITYDFTVTATSGPVAGEVSQGRFSYDSSIAVPDGFYDGVYGLLTALQFTFNGTAYTAATANINTGFVVFDASGELDFIVFGNHCPPGDVCHLHFDEDLDEVQWMVAGSPWYPTGDGLIYSVPGYLEPFFGDVTMARVVPEPGVLSLFACAAAALGAVAWRRRRLA